VNFQKNFEQALDIRVNYPNRCLCRRIGCEQGLWFAPVAGADRFGGEGRNRLKIFFDTGALFE
jgi:hypothetical protein